MKSDSFFREYHTRESVRPEVSTKSGHLGRNRSIRGHHSLTVQIFIVAY
jgi:hypothetical protein